MINKRCEYALRAIFELAHRGAAAGPVKIQRIAGSQGIPARFLEAILMDLRNAGLVESRRGSEGGYVLARDSRELLVADVLAVIQGQMSVSPESNNGADKPYCAGDSAFAAYWQKVDNELMKQFTETTFADLVQNERASRHQALDFTI